MHQWHQTTSRVDTLGFPFFTHCTKANVSDDQGWLEMLSHSRDYFRAQPVNIPSYHHLAGQWLSSTDPDRRLARTLSPDHDQDPV